MDFHKMSCYIVLCIFLTFYAFPEIFSSEPLAQQLQSFELCNSDLERKFLVDVLKCPHSGLFPVKQSCTAYIPCIRFGENLMRPLKQTECASGLAFDIFYLRCRPMSQNHSCLQTLCYPEGVVNDIVNDSFEPQVDASSSTDPTHSQEDFIEISVDSHDTACKEGSTKHEHTGSSHLTSFSSAADHEHCKSMWFFVSFLSVCFFLDMKK